MTSKPPWILNTATAVGMVSVIDFSLNGGPPHTTSTGCGGSIQEQTLNTSSAKMYLTIRTSTVGVVTLHVFHQFLHNDRIGVCTNLNSRNVRHELLVILDLRGFLCVWHIRLPLVWCNWQGTAKIDKSWSSWLLHLDKHDPCLEAHYEASVEIGERYLPLAKSFLS